MVITPLSISLYLSLSLCLFVVFFFFAELSLWKKGEELQPLPFALFAISCAVRVTIESGPSESKLQC